MSYPPRPPMGMPPMMGPQGYGYPPMGNMGMMQMGMGMMPMMQPHMNNPNNSNNANNADKKNKLVPQEIPKKEDKKEEKPPVTTVFVGNISDRAPDAMIRQMLQRCGNVLSWKRVQGASGKLQAFGFCEYESPEATLRAIRLLHNWMIPDKRLVVKVDAKTKALLDEWGRKKKKDTEDDKKKEDGEIVEDKDGTSPSDELDEFTLREDRVAKAGLDAIMREYASDIDRELPPGEEEPPKEDKPKRKKEKLSDGPKDAVSKRNLGLEDMELEDDKKEIINREIRSFRDAYKEDDPEEADKNSERGSGDSRRRQREQEREQERRMMRERERHEREARDRDRERERERERRERMAPTKSRSRSREPRAVPPPSTRLIPDHRDLHDDEEEHERRKLERKLREKQIAYQDLLKKWEQRERKKARDYEKEQDREEERKSEESKEARRLKEFLEDYDDERDDPKYYKSGALQRRLKEREKEMEADDRDRQREKEEIEELRKKLTEEGHSDVEGEVAKLEKERDAHLMPHHNKSPTPESSPPSSPEPDQQLQQQQRMGFHGAIPGAVQEEDSDDDDGKTGIIIPPMHSASATSQHDSDSSNDAQVNNNGRHYEDEEDNMDSRSPSGTPPHRAERERSLSQASMSSSHFYSNGPTQSLQQSSTQQSADDIMHTVYKGFTGVGGPGAPHSDMMSPEHPAQPSKRKKLTRDEVFNMDDDEDSTDGALKKRKLVPLDYTEEDRKPNPATVAAATVAAAAAAATAAAIIVKPTTAEEKRKCIKNLIERIPTAKEELFAYKLDWTMVDSTLMDRRIRPWVNKKIVEYIGEEEPTLSDFICQKVMGHCLPHTILSDIAMVLDEEAEVFVVKMWRLLIYETEAKKLGLVK